MLSVNIRQKVAVSVSGDVKHSETAPPRPSIEGVRFPFHPLRVRSLSLMRPAGHLSTISQIQTGTILVALCSSASPTSVESFIPVVIGNAEDTAESSITARPHPRKPAAWLPQMRL